MTSKLGVKTLQKQRLRCRKIFEDALGAGLPANLHNRLKQMLEEYRDVFRTRLGQDPAASLPPMIIRMQNNARPVRVRARRYSPQQATFLESKVSELERLGINFLVRFNNSSQ